MGIAVIDGARDTVIAQVSLPQGYAPTAMTSVESDSLVMVAVYGSGVDSVFTVAVEYDSIVAALPVGRNPSALERSAVTGLIYCANGSNDNLTVISSDGARVTGQVAVSDFPHVLLACSNYTKLYVGHSGETSMLYVVRDRVALQEPGLPVLQRPVRATATVVRGGAFYHNSDEAASIVDVSGRRVRDVAAGANDLSTLALGVYVLVAGQGVPPRKLVKLR